MAPVDVVVVVVGEVHGGLVPSSGASDCRRSPGSSSDADGEVLAIAEMDARMVLALVRSMGASKMRSRLRGRAEW